MDASGFVDMIMFANGPSNQLSLEDLTNDFCEQHDVSISKQGLNERFNDFSVAFMAALLKEQLCRQLPSVQNIEGYQHFRRVRLKDSTRYTLPGEYASVYKGQGGIGSAAQISIQYEYDLLTGTAIDLNLTSGCRNDQQDSKETLGSIEKDDLMIRDLAYAGQAYIRHITSVGAFYLNRLNPRWKVCDNQRRPIDFSKILRKLKRFSLPLMELEIFIEINKELYASRLIVSRVSQQTYKKRITKATIAAASKAYNVTDKYKTHASLNLFITNVPKQWLSTEQIRATYSLRWQIELIFKVWKSQAHINKVKAMKLQRFQCQLIARLLWILLHWQALRITQQWMEIKCSVWKFYKVAFRISTLLRQVLLGRQPLDKWLGQILNQATKKYWTETKAEKKCGLGIISNLLA